MSCAAASAAAAIIEIVQIAKQSLICSPNMSADAASDARGRTSWAAAVFPQGLGITVFLLSCVKF